jgi:FtsP/CotA-like multicopper oxidase with cupredoxin domain
MTNRRNFSSGSAAALLGAAADPTTPVTLNGWTLPWRMKDGVKEFHLVAEPVQREIAPGMKANLWGYNGQSPGPTIECVEGDRVRIFVTNKPAGAHHDPLARHPAALGMDGVGGLTQPQIGPARPSSTSSRCGSRAPSCTTRTPTRWCRWRWA